MTAYSHGRCYAGKLADCSGSISREHYFSHAILRAIGGGGPVLTKGLAWQKPGAQQFIPTQGLASNVLCTAHNSRLSPLDEEASRLFQFLQHFHRADRTSVPASAELTVNGLLIERWMLKSICGFVASKTSPTRYPARVRLQKPSDWWVDMLFGESPIPIPFGLHFWGGTPGAASTRHDRHTSGACSPPPSEHCPQRR